MNGKVNFIALGTSIQYRTIYNIRQYCHCLSMTISIVDSCKKVALAFDSVVSSLEVLNCQSIQAQVCVPVFIVMSCDPGVRIR